MRLYFPSSIGWLRNVLLLTVNSCNQDKESVLLVIASLNEFLIFAQFACLNAELCYFWLLHLAKKMKYKQQSEFFTGMIETVKL